MKRLFVFALLLVASTSYAGVVQPLGAASQILIPAAGSAPGANGTFFRSDISIINLASHDQQVLIQWLPAVGSGSIMSNMTTIRALQGIRSADFVRDYLNVNGLGSLVITGVTSAGFPDATATLYVNSRIWTPQPGTDGTTSQSFPAIPVGTINTPAAALFAVGGPDNPGHYRVNVGIVNVDPTNTQTFLISFPSILLIPNIIVTLPPLTMQQVSLGSLSPSAQVSIQNTTATGTRSNLWTAYASTVDNVTGDAWSEIAVAGTAPAP